MLYVFGFDRVCVVVGDLYFVDPAPLKGQEGAEHGVRVELRVIERGAARGSIYAAIPITVDRPIWRGDFLEAVGGRPFDRTHHHPAFTGWDPGERVFDRELFAAPFAWLGERLADLDGLLAAAGVPPDTAGPSDAADLRALAPHIVDTSSRLVDQVRGGELGRPPREHAPVVDDRPVLVRSGWL